MPSPCKTCHRLYAPLRKGECVSCYRFRRRTGTTRTYGEKDGRPIGSPSLENHYAWKGDKALPTTKRERIQRRFILGACELCGEIATDRHHKDGNPGNNDLSNIQPLCRHCHMETDGRLKKFKSTCKGLKSREQCKGKYPNNWKFISDDVCRLAGHRCIRCGHPYRKGAHGRGEWTECDSKCHHPGPVKVEGGTIFAQWRILTVHHFDGNKENCEWFNLLALCQRCHLHIQGKVDPEQPWMFEHADWFKPYIAGFYARKYERRNITRAEAMARLDELLAYELRTK